MFSAIVQSIIRSTKRRMPGLPEPKKSSGTPQKDRTSLILILIVAAVIMVAVIMTAIPPR
ncbi:MAG: hypothetical protein WCK07_04330 [Betaproteobacteria bacterium]|jgi:hypothetical protein